MSGAGPVTQAVTDTRTDSFFRFAGPHCGYPLQCPGVILDGQVIDVPLWATQLVVMQCC